jgi:alkylhydroperoxidase/carboxymuconolactone decarboxylase family protein YurZ
MCRVGIRRRVGFGDETVVQAPSLGEAMSESALEDTPVLDLLAGMTADSVEASSLDVQTIALVRLAALVASGAPAASYALNLAAAGEVGLDAEDVRGVLTAVAPIVGTSRVVGATGRIAVALGVAIEVASAEQDDELG